MHIILPILAKTNSFLIFKIFNWLLLLFVCIKGTIMHIEWVLFTSFIIIFKFVAHYMNKTRMDGKTWNPFKILSQISSWAIFVEIQEKKMKYNPKTIIFFFRWIKICIYYEIIKFCVNYINQTKKKRKKN